MRKAYSEEKKITYVKKVEIITMNEEMTYLKTEKKRLLVVAVQRLGKMT